MMQIKDMRNKYAKKEAAAHAKQLEQIIQDHKQSGLASKLASSIIKQASDFALITGAGYLAGYSLNRNTDTAVQFAEYASLIWLATKSCRSLPMAAALLLFRKKIKFFNARLKKRARIEELKSKQLAKKGELHKYKPKYGFDYNNSQLNIQTAFENKIKEEYCKKVQAAKMPIRTAVIGAVGGAWGFFIVSLAMDIPSHIADYITGLNPIEYYLKSVHYIASQITETSFIDSHEHAGNFDQLHMVYSGVMFGLMYTAKNILQGCYSRIKTIPKILKQT